MPGTRRTTIDNPMVDDPGGLREGLVIRTSGGRCFVVAGGSAWSCQVRGKLKKGKQVSQTVVVAGDRVLFSPLEGEDGATGVVEEILPRRNRISRLAARRSGGRIEQILMANLDQVVVVQSLREPTPQTGLVDRLLMASSRFEVDGVLVLNKVDLEPPAEETIAWDYYSTLGYRVIRTSAAAGLGIEELRRALSGRLSIFLGASGVGKSSLLNALDQELGLRVAEVTLKTGLGRHTTTQTELFPLPDGGYIADSPGIRGFDPWDVDPQAVRDYFPEFQDAADRCRFRTCLHRDEPVCGVKDAVAARRIPSWRYAAYLQLVRDLETRRKESGLWR